MLLFVIKPFIIWNGWTLGHSKRQVDTQTYAQKHSNTVILTYRHIDEQKNIILPLYTYQYPIRLTK